MAYSILFQYIVLLDYIEAIYTCTAIMWCWFSYITELWYRLHPLRYWLHSRNAYSNHTNQWLYGFSTHFEIREMKKLNKERGCAREYREKTTNVITHTFATNTQYLLTLKCDKINTMHPYCNTSHILTKSNSFHFSYLCSTDTWLRSRTRQKRNR